MKAHYRVMIQVPILLVLLVTLIFMNKADATFTANPTFEKHNLLSWQKCSRKISLMYLGRYLSQTGVIGPNEMNVQLGKNIISNCGNPPEHS